LKGFYRGVGISVVWIHDEYIGWICSGVFILPDHVRMVQTTITDQQCLSEPLFLWIWS
jgi:hypothetical protein